MQVKTEAVDAIASGDLHSQDQIGGLTVADLVRLQIEAFKYRWIRANRGSFAIDAALHGAGRDSEFDAQIEAAIRMSVQCRHYASAFMILDGPATPRPR